MSAASATGLNALAGTFTALAIITTVVRFYAIHRKRLALHIEDWLVIPAALTFIGASVCIWIAVSKKFLGYSSFQFTPEETEAGAKLSTQLQLPVDTLTIVCISCAKASALFYYRRAFSSGFKGLFNVLALSSVVVVLLWAITFLILTLAQCGSHFSAMWTTEFLKYCKISFPALYGLALSDLLLNIWVIALPVPLILLLRTTLLKKLSIVGVVLLACVAIGASAARLKVYLDIKAGATSGSPHFDRERMVSETFYYTMLEAGISVLVINVPSFWLLFTNSKVDITDGRETGKAHQFAFHSKGEKQGDKQVV